eukprot:CAMPEP_0175155594 /NCGR_PEP_ID=MMETSP0087-20121206/21080_1 /TAXON_ID=136419 /ORGANISM="Unknown Unknown, Strain D1" /LENGTH=180 /DNA_ID=CAMNT_0016442803 /DNA_START=51 /DNA_END=590 /DNA_ORIENTATION=+
MKRAKADLEQSQSISANVLEESKLAMEKLVEEKNQVVMEQAKEIKKQKKMLDKAKKEKEGLQEELEQELKQLESEDKNWARETKAVQQALVQIEKDNEELYNMLHNLEGHKKNPVRRSANSCLTFWGGYLTPRHGNLNASRKKGECPPKLPDALLSVCGVLLPCTAVSALSLSFSLSLSL